MTSFHKFCIEQGYGVDEEFLFTTWFKRYLSRYFSYSHEAYEHLAKTMEPSDVEKYWGKYKSEKRLGDIIKEDKYDGTTIS